MEDARGDYVSSLIKLTEPNSDSDSEKRTREGTGGPIESFFSGVRKICVSFDNPLLAVRKQADSIPARTYSNNSNNDN